MHPGHQQFYQGYDRHVEAQHDVRLEDFTSGLAIVRIQRHNMPRHVYSPDPQSQHPEYHRQVGIEGSHDKESDLEHAEEGKEDPDMISKQDCE